VVASDPGLGQPVADRGTEPAPGSIATTKTRCCHQRGLHFSQTFTTTESRPSTTPMNWRETPWHAARPRRRPSFAPPYALPGSRTASVPVEGARGPLVTSVLKKALRLP
jgi:hypothetical protein